MLAYGWAPTAIVAPVGAVGVFFNGALTLPSYHPMQVRPYRLLAYRHRLSTDHGSTRILWLYTMAIYHGSILWLCTMAIYHGYILWLCSAGALPAARLTLPAARTHPLLACWACPLPIYHPTRDHRHAQRRGLHALARRRHGGRAKVGRPKVPRSQLDRDRSSLAAADAPPPQPLHPPRAPGRPLAAAVGGPAAQGCWSDGRRRVDPPPRYGGHRLTLTLTLTLTRYGGHRRGGRDGRARRTRGATRPDPIQSRLRPDLAQCTCMCMCMCMCMS